jgi:type II secretory pathway component PulF
MAYFNYRAIDESSRIIKGKIDAASEEDLETKLGNQQLTLIEATRSTFGLIRKPKLREKDLLQFTYFLNVIVSSGIPIMSGLSDMANQSISGRISQAASLLSSDLKAGKSISDSMLDHPGLFPPFYTSMIKAGETSGKLELVLNDIMSYLEWQIKLKKEVKAGLSYPAIVLCAVAALITILFVFVMPKFMTILSGLKVDLPLPTKILVFAVEFMKGYWPLLIGILLLLPFLYGLARRNEKGRRVIDRVMLKIPLVGELVRKLNHSRYFRTFATLYRSGLDMRETLDVSHGVVGNTVIADALHRVTGAVLGGEMLSSALNDSGGFPSLVINMVEIGEKTGTLDSALLRISDLYDREIPETLKRIFTILEPLIIVLLGGLVLLTLASFFLPLYKIIGGIRK